MARLKLLGVLGVVFCFCALASPALGDDLRFGIGLHIPTGNYASHTSVTGGSRNETDDFNLGERFLGIHVPRRGKPKDISRPADDWGLDGTWEGFGRGNGGAYDCTGDVSDADFKKNRPHVTSGDGTSKKRVELLMGTGKKFTISGASGSDSVNDTGCAKWWDDARAFFPGYLDVLDGAMTVDVKFALAKLRRMKKNDTIHLNVNSDNDAAKQLPSDCSQGVSFYTCTESVHWKGFVTLKRTG